MFMISDEEIEAIQKVKEAIRIDKEQRIVTIYDEKPLFRDRLQIIIDLIEKQQKEIEELKKPKYIINCKTNEITKLTNDFINKDKIIEKIKHYNNELEHIKNGEEFENEKPMYYWGKVALENLLEEN